ncbi:MAG: tRNA (adenosine(37)-N6)-threonylcarbamoyltransferase complex ATPase subunit type 1 TsaE [Wenzhouxiangellaceae bacterium]|nr:tRNA (adenosine(37)-N6)-threonylcarbamoyltransferase complex ATPase subunit type 1 TsaE [Wenzhouxiangellaceae bacterium]
MNPAPARSIQVNDEAEMLALGGQLARELSRGQVWTLSGDLGAGKTTLVRGILRGLGFDGRVKSPSYGLVESYRLDTLTVHHLDLYRLGDPDELDFIGLADLIGDDSVLLIEWPERGGIRLPAATHRLTLEIDAESRRVTIEVHGR